jgi:hypothetical protein
MKIKNGWYLDESHKHSLSVTFKLAIHNDFLQFFFFCMGIWSLTLMQENGLKMSEKKAAIKERVIEVWRKCHNKKFNNLQSDDIMVKKSRRMGWTGHSKH